MMSRGITILPFSIDLFPYTVNHLLFRSTEKKIIDISVSARAMFAAFRVNGVSAEPPCYRALRFRSWRVVVATAPRVVIVISLSVLPRVLDTDHSVSPSV